MQRLIQRSIPVALSCLMAGVVAMPAAHAQFSVVDPAAQTVMSSRDFNALLESINFDAGQRATAGPLFDDMQRELIAARDELAATQPPARNADARAHADQEARKRRAYQRMGAAEQTFFDGLLAFATPDQQSAVERERLAATRRLVRRTLGASQSSLGPVRVDFVTAVQDSQLAPADKARALTALAGYQTQLTALLQQALDQGLEVDAKTAKLREQKPAAPTTTELQVEGAIDMTEIGGDPVRREASAAFDGTIDKIAALHLQAMASLESALTPLTADSLAAAAAKRIWPRAAMDARSPRAAFAQMRREIDRGKRPAEQRAALDAAQPAWLSAWWTCTRKACEAENSLRRYGMFGAMNEETKELRRAIRDARAERDEANRNAWKALAAIDGAHAEFYAPYIAAPDPANSMMMFAGPGEPAPPSLEDRGVEGVQMAQSFSAAMIMVRSESSEGGEGEVEGDDTLAMPIVMEASGDGPIAISVGPDGVASFMSDTVGDGMNSGEMPMFVNMSGPRAPQLSGARMPAPMTRDQALAVVRAVAGDAAPSATMDQLYKDYAERAQAVDDTAGKAARDLLAGSIMGFETIETNEKGEPVEAPPQMRSMTDLRAGVGKLDAYVTRLAEVDDALIAGLVAACAPGATPAQVKALSEERARDRLSQLKYPTSPAFMHDSPRGSKPIEMGTVVQKARLSAVDRAAADAIIAEWSPAALGAMEQSRATLRTVSLDLLEAERKMMTQVHQGGGGEPVRSREVRMEMSSEDEGAIREHQSLMERVRTAGKGNAVLARETRERLEAALTPEGRAELLAAWCQVVAPQAFEDARNAESRLAQALALGDLTPEQARQIQALRTTHTGEHAALTARIGMVAADLAIPPTDAKDTPARGGSRGDPARAQLDRLRFDRSELNERTLRRLRTILTPTQNESVPGLGSSAKAPRIEVQGAP